jgi:hypothetical protein
MNMNKDKKLCPICRHYFDKNEMVLLRRKFSVGLVYKSCYGLKRY